MGDVIPLRPTSGEPWITKAQAARHLGVSLRTVERWGTEGGLPFRRVRSLNLYRRSELDEWVERMNVQARLDTCE